MNIYLIQHKIATVSKLEKSFKYKSYNFEAYDPKEWWKCHAWTASKTITAENFIIAFRKFIQGLLPLINEFSVISQCAFRFAANSYFIYKIDDNKSKAIFIRYVRKTQPVGLGFGDEEISQLPKFSKIKNKSALLYITDAANATTFYGKLSMLIMAAEGLAGEIIINNRLQTNPIELKKILGNKLHKKLFPRKVGLRNILFHGKVKRHRSFDGLVEKVYLAIRSYLRTQHDINLSNTVVHPQRNFHDNFEERKSFYALKDNSIPSIKKIEEVLTDRDGSNPKEQEIFNYLTNNPENY